MKYNVQNLNNIEIGNRFVKKIAHELRNNGINQISDNTEFNVICNRTKETLINSATEILRMALKEYKKNLFTDICKDMILVKNELRIFLELRKKRYKMR